MSRLLVIFFLVSVLVLAIGNSANAQPIPIDLYESEDNTPTGTPSETGPPVFLDFLIAIGPGTAGTPVTGDSFIVLLESDTNNHAIENWSDVIKITTPLLDGISLTQIASFEIDEQYIGVFQDTLLGSIVQLFSDPDFGTVSGSITDLNAIWLAEDPSGTTSLGLLIVHSDADAVPEPSTFVLLGAGLAGVGLLRRRFKK